MNFMEFWRRPAVTCLLAFFCLSTAQGQTAPGTTIVSKPYPTGQVKFLENYLYQNVIATYDRRDPPLNLTVVLSFRIEQVNEISTKNGVVTVNAAIRLWWVDERLAFPANGTNGLLMRKSDIWYPDDVDVVNTFETKNLPITSPYVRVKPDGSCYSSTVKQYDLNCPMDIIDFPYDKQLCSIHIESWLHGADAIVLTASGNSAGLLARNARSSLEFEMKDGGFYTSTHSSFGSSYRALHFELILERYPHFYINNFVIPAIMLAYLSWAGMYLDRKATPARVGLGITVCLTQAALKIPITQLVPVANHASWLDGLLSAVFIFAFVSVVEYVLVNSIEKRNHKILSPLGLKLTHTLHYINHLGRARYNKDFVRSEEFSLQDLANSISKMISKRDRANMRAKLESKLEPEPVPEPQPETEPVLESELECDPVPVHLPEPEREPVSSYGLFSGFDCITISPNSPKTVGLGGATQLRLSESRVVEAKALGCAQAEAQAQAHPQTLVQAQAPEPPAHSHSHATAIEIGAHIDKVSSIISSSDSEPVPVPQPEPEPEPEPELKPELTCHDLAEQMEIFFRAVYGAALTIFVLIYVGPQI